VIDTLFTVREHRLVGARECPSPNADDRPADATIDLVVVHGISLPPGYFGTGDVDALFTNALDPGAHPAYAELCAMRVSSHLLIDRAGDVTQYVPFDARAWHAGVSAWRGRARCNDFAVGIELEGTDRTPYTEAQYRVLAAVVRALRAAYPTLAPDALAGHDAIAPGRKTDPGPAFDWAHLHALLAA
jgi:AmpD protein